MSYETKSDLNSTYNIQIEYLISNRTTTNITMLLQILFYENGNSHLCLISLATEGIYALNMVNKIILDNNNSKLIFVSAKN